jgi:cytochrome P450
LLHGGVVVIGDFVAFRRDPSGFLLRLAQAGGDVAHFRLGRRDAYLLNQPDLIKEVLVTRAADFGIGGLLQRARGFLGNSLLTSDGDFHREQRQRIRPCMRRELFDGHGETICRLAAEHADRHRGGAAFDMGDAMAQLNMAIVATTLFSTPLDDAGDLRRALETIVTRAPLLTLPFAHLADRIPIPWLHAVHRAIRQLDARIVELARIAPAGIPRELRDAGMPERQVRDEVLTLFLAGHETTAAALTWVWYVLATRPDVEARLHAELDAIVGERAPAAADFERLVYTRAVIDETLRLYPPIARMGRRSRVPFHAGGYQIAPGSSVFVCPYALHRDPRFYARPHLFDPDRWRAGRAAPFTFLPFGAGPRSCIGEPMARFVMTMVIAAIARRHQVRMVRGHRLATRTLLTLRPRELVVTILRRAHAA